MKNKLLVIIFLLFVGGDCFGQITFQRVITMGIASDVRDIKQTSDNGYITCGYTVDSMTNNYYVFLIKLNPEGDTLWTKTYGRIHQYVGNSVQQTIDGGYIIAGQMNDTSYNTYIYIIKTDDIGDTLWTKAYNENNYDEAQSVAQTNDSGFIIAGEASGTGIGSTAIRLLKINASGTVIWCKAYGGDSANQGECVKQTVDSGYIICGNTGSFGAGGRDVYLIKTKANGDTLWTRTYGGAFDDFGQSVEQTTDGGYIIACGTFSFGNVNGAVYLIKTNANGDTLWTKTYGDGNGNGASDVHQTADGGYIITGYSLNLGGFTPNTLLIKTNSVGDTLWTKTYGGHSESGGSSVIQTKDGGYIIAANRADSLPSGFENCTYLIKTDANGNSGCSQGTTTIIVASTATVAGGTNSIIDSGITAFPTHTIVGNGGNDSTLCLTTSINEQSINNIISLYPNPTNDQLTITGNWQANQNMQLSIFNMLGETIYTQAANSKQLTQNCKSFPSGIYFVRIANEKESWVGKFVKE